MHRHRRIDAHGPAPTASTREQHPATLVPNPHTAAPVARSRSGAVLLAVLLVAQLMVILDITAVNIALPSIATDLELTRLDDQLDDHELLADLRQPAPLRRPRR